MINPKQPKTFRIRRWLNKPGQHSIAHVYVSMTHDAYMDFKIADCDRTISLSFDFHDVHSLNNTISKMDSLIEALIQSRERIITTQLPFLCLKAAQGQYPRGLKSLKKEYTNKPQWLKLLREEAYRSGPIPANLQEAVTLIKTWNRRKNGRK